MAAARMTAKQCTAALKKRALAYPEVVEDHPWGHHAYKVKGKIFLILDFDPKQLGGMRLSLKLPQSGKAAVGLGFAEPTGYGLGKSGWVTARFAPDVTPPLEVLLAWLDESFRAIAPKRLVKTLDGPAPAPKKRK
jgi:predicted DNA-binding protein (MmcQ/YjbR family)